MSLLTEQILCYILLAISFTIAIFVSYYTFLYYTCRRNTAIIKRHYSIVLALNIVCLIMCVISPFIPLQNLFFKMPTISYIILIRFSSISLEAVFAFCILLRTWLLHFDIKYSIISRLNLNVLTFINEQESINNWYLKNKSTFGNQRWMAKILFLPMIIWSIVLCIIIALFPQILFFIGSAMFWSIFTIIIFIWCKTPKIVDSFKCWKEIRFIIIAGFAKEIIIVCMGILMYLDPSRKRIYHIFAIFFALVYAGQVCLFSTLWVLKYSGTITEIKLLRNDRTFIEKNMNMKAMNIELRDMKEEYPKMSMVVKFFSVGHTSINLYSHLQGLMHEHKDDIWFPNITLSVILSHSLGFDRFVLHLLHEFSTENILALIEFVQFSRFYENALELNYVVIEDDVSENINTLIEKQEKKKKHISSLISFPAHVPKSSIVYNEKLSMFEKIELLVDKYIERGAQFELNISVRLRKRLCGMMDHLSGDEEQYIYVFDDVSFTIFMLMADSFSRFRMTAEFRSLVNDHQIQHEDEKLD